MHRMTTEPVSGFPSLAGTSTRPEYWGDQFLADQAVGSCLLAVERSRAHLALLEARLEALRHPRADAHETTSGSLVEGSPSGMETSSSTPPISLRRR